MRLCSINFSDGLQAHTTFLITKNKNKMLIINYFKTNMYTNFKHHFNVVLFTLIKNPYQNNIKKNRYREKYKKFNFI